MLEMENAAKQVRKCIREAEFPPKFPDANWIQADEDYIKANCFAYAINSSYGTIDMYKLFFEENMYMPEHDDSEIIEAFEKRMYFLNIPFLRTTYEEVLPKNYYKIGVCNSFYTRDFHFIRQNSDGCWSHKEGWIRDPSYLCDVFENPSRYVKKCGYNIIAYYAIGKLE